MRFPLAPANGSKGAWPAGPARHRPGELLVAAKAGVAGELDQGDPVDLAQPGKPHHVDPRMLPPLPLAVNENPGRTCSNA